MAQKSDTRQISIHISASTKAKLDALIEINDAGSRGRYVAAIIERDKDWVAGAKLTQNEVANDIRRQLCLHMPANTCEILDQLVKDSGAKSRGQFISFLVEREFEKLGTTIDSNSGKRYKEDLLRQITVQIRDSTCKDLDFLVKATGGGSRGRLLTVLIAQAKKRQSAVIDDAVLNALSRSNSQLLMLAKYLIKFQETQKHLSEEEVEGLLRLIRDHVSLIRDNFHT